MKTKLESINAIAELQRLGWRYENLNESEVRLKCPVHDDTSPSVNLNVTKNVWKCHACDAKGDLIALLAYCLKTTRGAVIEDLSKRYDLTEVKFITPDSVEKFHDKIGEAGPLLTALRDRGITDEDIRIHRLGYYQGRITIPVYDADRRVINVRRYLPGAPGPEKMQNTKGFGAPAIYGIEELAKYERVWFCGGEMKRIVTSRLLNPHGIGAISVTGSEGTWDPKWQSLVKGKQIYVCFDVDAKGQSASRKIATMLRRSASAVFIINLPLDTKKYPKGDINDLVGQEKATDKDLLALMDGLKEFIPTGLVGEPDSVAIEVPLVSATLPANIGKRVAFEAVAIAMDTTPFIVPKEVDLVCGQDQKCCDKCPIFGIPVNPLNGVIRAEVLKTSIGIVEMVNNPLSKQRDAIRMSLGIPNCRTVEFYPRSNYRVHDLRLTPQISIGSEHYGNVVLPALVVDLDVEMNTPYKMEGVSHPHPKNQQAVLLVDAVTQADDNLESFKPTVEELEELKVFQPSSWSLDSLQDKINEIYADLEANVTHIFRRRELLAVYDLTFHSCVMFNFEGRLQTGWMNSLVIGDSGQGKSETANTLIEHYGVGERVECKNATVAGLLGGLQQMGTRWFVSWGVIPTHDRRLVVLEELKGASTETIGKLTDMRSRGVAEIPKIERRRTHARTRIIANSNPRSSRSIRSFNFGLESIRELIGGLEDIRRFDIGVILSSGDIPSKEINNLMVSRPVVEHFASRELCRRLVLFAWTVKPDRIYFEAAATDAILKKSVYLTDRYDDSIPLIDRGTIRFKIARIAIAVAIRTWSVDAEYNVVVRDCHVEFAAGLLDTIYAGDTFGYLKFSKAVRMISTIRDPIAIRRAILGTKFPRDFAHEILYRDEITAPDIMDWCDLDKDSAQRLISFFVRKHCLYREKLFYRKTAEFIKLLKELESEGVPESVEPIDGEEM